MVPLRDCKVRAGRCEAERDGEALPPASLAPPQPPGAGAAAVLPADPAPAGRRGRRCPPLGGPGPASKPGWERGCWRAVGLWREGS